MIVLTTFFVVWHGLARVATSSRALDMSVGLPVRYTMSHLTRRVASTPALASMIYMGRLFKSGVPLKVCLCCRLTVLGYPVTYTEAFNGVREVAERAQRGLVELYSWGGQIENLGLRAAF